jgi:uncharacterized SAM-binding protein YcdF (DUF218 family)
MSAISKEAILEWTTPGQLTPLLLLCNLPLMRRLLQLIGQLVAAAIVIVIFSVVWIIFDGLTNLGDRAEVALVFSDPTSKENTDARLKRVAELHKDGDFTAVIVSGSGRGSSHETPAAMSKYLADRGIPAATIIEVSYDENEPGTAEHIAEVLKEHHFNSVMFVTNYYNVTLTKLQFTHAGIANLQKQHIGALQKEDAWKITNSLIALYSFIGQTYLLPAAEKVKAEAKVGAEKAQADAAAAKQSLDKKFDNLPK